MKLNRYAPPLRLIRSHAETSTDTFEMDANDFIYKLNIAEEFLNGLKKIPANQTGLRSASSNFFVRVNSRLERIDLKSIFHVEALSDYVTIHTKEKRYTIYCSMKAMESKLPSTDFTKVHKSFIVRLDRISEIENDTLIVEKKLIPIGLTYRNQLRACLNIL